jgi:hypothetical protein
MKEFVEPFLKKLKTIHVNNIDLIPEEKEKLMETVKLIEIYSSKEASLLKTIGEKKILYDLNCELAIVMRFANDAKKGKLYELYSDCAELQKQLLKLEDDVLAQEKLVA